MVKKTQQKPKVDRLSKYVKGMQRLSWFLEDSINRTGLSVRAFCDKYGINAMTMSNYLNRLNFPDNGPLIQIADALSQELGEEIGFFTLIRLLDPFENPPDRDTVLKEYIPLPKAIELLHWYEELPIEERVTIAPALLSKVSKDLAYTTSSKAHTLALLLREELTRKNWGVARFASHYNLNEQTLQKILLAEKLFVSPDFSEVPIAEIKNICVQVKDQNGLYGNYPLFLRLFGVNMGIKTACDRVMLQHSLKDTNELVSYLVNKSKYKFDDTAKAFLVKSLDECLALNQIPQQTDPVFYQILPELAEELGFDSLMDFFEAISSD